MSISANQTSIPIKNHAKGLLMLAILWCAYVAFAMNWISGSTLSPQIVDTFFGHPVQPIVMQVVNYTITAARVVANFIAAYVLIKTGPQRAVKIALFLLMFSMVAVWVPSYWGYTIARMVMALGGSMVIVYMNPVVANYVAPKKKMIANALNTVSYNVGAFFTSILFVLFAQQLKVDWRITMTFMAASTIILFVLWLLFSEDFETKSNVSSGSGEIINYTYKDALKDGFVWRYAIGFSGFLFLYVLSITSFPAVLPQYAPKINGSLINMLITGFAIVGTFIGMKIGLTNVKRKKVLLVSGAIMIIAFAGSLYFANSITLLAYILAAVSGLFMYIQYPIYMNLPHEMPNMSAQKLTIIFGLFWAISYSLYTIFTIVWSIILGSSGWLAASVFYIAVSSLYVWFAFTLPETK